MSEYPGVISRNELVTFCQELVAHISNDIDILEKAYQISMKQVDLHRCAQFQETINMRMGEQSALRTICEWAKDHLEK